MNTYMARAIELAKRGLGNTNPNPMVGAVVVKEGKIIGEGFHKKFGGPHAEVFAIEDAGSEAEGATVYVTLEPCSHYGKTPPCAELLVKSKIKKCVIGLKDPNPLIAGRGIAILEEAGIEVEVGIMQEEIQKMNRVFLHQIQKKEPFFYLKTAITLDGKIALANGDSKWISNSLSREFVQELRTEFMGIMVGVNTLNNDNPSLTARREKGVDPLRIVIDPYLNTNLDSNFVAYAQKDDLSLIITSEDEREKAQRYSDLGVRFIFFEGRVFDPVKIKKKLYMMGVDSVLVEGGSGVISSFIKADAIDAGTIFIAPKIVGNSEAIPLIDGLNPEKMSEAALLTNVEYEVFGDNVAMHFRKE